MNPDPGAYSEPTCRLVGAATVIYYFVIYYFSITLPIKFISITVFLLLHRFWGLRRPDRGRGSVAQ